MRPVAICVGLGRTGTTTFGDAAEILGFSRLGWDKTDYIEKWGDWPHIIDAWQNGRFEAIYDVAEKYDVFEDLPWPLMYREMAERYPEVKFVLTRRASARKWLRSQIGHTRRESDYDFHQVVYGAKQAEQARRKYIDTYRRHLGDVRAYFEGSDRLLEVCWEEGDGWEQLCPFLGVPVPDEPFPHSNAAPTTESGVRHSIRRLLRA